MSTTSPASPRQMELIDRLLRERATTFEALGVAPDSLTGGRDGSASALIDRLFDMPKPCAPEGEPEAPRATEVSVAEPGVYEMPDGRIFQVRQNRAKTRLYAKSLREIGGTRTTEAGTFVAVEFEYAPGVIFDLRPEYRMPLERARELTLRYGRCLACGRALKAGESVEQGIGPVCVKSFPRLVEERRGIVREARREARELTPTLLPEDRAEAEASADRPTASQGDAPRPASGLVAMAQRIGAPREPAEAPPEEHPIDAEARSARALFVAALYAYQTEADCPDSECAKAIATFDRLVAGYER